MTTLTKPKTKLLTASEWSELMFKNHGQGWGMAALEQAMYQSKKHKVCIDCLSTESLIQCQSYCIASIDYYYMCQTCKTYYDNK